MSKVNLNIAYLGEKGANINLGKIDEIEITSPDNTVEVINKTYDEATKILTFELKAGSINDVEITSSDNSVEVVGKEYNVETKVLTLDLKVAKSLSITSEDETVKVTEKNGKVDLGVKQVSVAPLDATTSVELDTDASGNETYKVGAFSTHTVIEEKKIVKPNPVNASPKPDWLKSYVVECNVVNRTFEFFDTNSMEARYPANRTATNKVTYNVDMSPELQYVRFVEFSASSWFSRIKITIRTIDGLEQEHYISIAQDTPNDATFTFITTLNWNIYCFIEPMVAFLEVPSGFAGSITSEVVYAFCFSGSWYAYQYKDAEGKLQERSYFKEGGGDIVSEPLSLSEYQTMKANYVSIDGYSDLQPNAGRYRVDGLFPMTGWELGKKIPDSLPNDIMLHQLQIDVKQLEIDYRSLVRQINFTSSDGSINVNPIEGGGTDYTVNWTKLLANGILEITDDNKSDYYDSATGIISNIPPNTQTIAFNTSLVETVKAIQGGNYNGRRITLVGSYTMSNEYADTDTDGRFSRYLLGYRYGVPGGEIAYSLDELFEDFVYFNGIWFSKGY